MVASAHPTRTSPAGGARVGELLRSWRLRRNLSQQALANGSAVSTRYLSFIETGRARPSREMVMHLAERLEVPLRDRNDLLFAAGYAPIYRERPLDSAEMAPVRRALDRFLKAHEPYPALIVDRRWNILAANRAFGILTEGVGTELLQPPANAFRIALHPRGMAPRILNLAEWSSHALRRVQRQAAITGDPELELLYNELASFPGVDPDAPPGDPGEAILMHRLRLRDGELTFFSTVTHFGTATDIALAELAIEAFFPADEHSAAILRAHPAQT
jgi:transcriptional regulator with XRE-family HTH domain